MVYGVVTRFNHVVNISIYNTVIEELFRCDMSKGITEPA
jgi:hypothetical protein